MLTVGNDLSTKGPGFSANSTPVEQILFFMEGKSQDRPSAQAAARSLQCRLERLRHRTGRIMKLNGINKVELSSQVLTLIEN